MLDTKKLYDLTNKVNEYNSLKSIHDKLEGNYLNFIPPVAKPLFVYPLSFMLGKFEKIILSTRLKKRFSQAIEDELEELSKELEDMGVKVD